MSQDKNPEDQMLDDLLGEKLEACVKQAAPPPAELHQEVFSTLDALNFLGELAEFFTLKFTEAEFSIFEAANEAFFEENDSLNAI